MKQQLYFIGVAIILCLNSCNKDKDTDQTSCDEQVIVNNDEYNNTSNDQIEISALQIEDNCVKFTLSASGCDGNTWIVKLIDSDEILYSEPPQRNIKVSFQNNEECVAVISKEFIFDITELQVSGNKVYLNIVNTGDQILYEY